MQSEPAVNEMRTLLLKNAHVVDPAQGIDRVADVAIENGKVAGIGACAPAPGAQVIDLAGHYLSPGWIDVHVHAYGTLGFADPDSIGIYQGVTTFVEAGGPGIGTLDEFTATMEGTTITDLYVGPYLRPMGIIGLSYIEGEVRSLRDIPIAQWLDYAEAHRDSLRYLKLGAFESFGTGPLMLGKGLAELLELPMYVHIGEFQVQPKGGPSMDIFRIAGAGDIITHLYHGNVGKVLDEAGRVLPVVREAERRGVLFDIGFGGYNFSWDVAEKAYAQDLVPHMISSDLQQFNVTGPVYSLANVLGIFARLGMPLADIVERVTLNPARALSLQDRAGSLRPGMPADITVFKVESGEYALSDCARRTRVAERRIVPVMAFKRGARVDCDLERYQDERNWFMQIAEDRPPAAAEALSPAQLAFAGSLAAALETVDWKMCTPQRLDLDKATELQEAFHRVRSAHPLSLKAALGAVYDCFLDHPFRIQVGLFLLRLERPFVLERLRLVAAQRTGATADT
jgi:dihydroorotase